MRPNDIVGYTADEQFWCLTCVGIAYVPRVYLDDPRISTIDRSRHEIQPIHTGTEFNAQPTCARCNCDLPVLVLPLCLGCGLYHQGSRHPRRSMHMPAEAKELARR